MPASGTPVQSVKEHRKVTEDIDDAYIATIQAATNMQSFLVGVTGGSRREQFLAFHRSFYTLFAHTRYMTGMNKAEAKKEGGKEEDSYVLVDDLEAWFLDCKNINVRRKNFPSDFIEDGLVLFAEYQKKLLTIGVVTITR
jgi:hypothetical protein